MIKRLVFHVVAGIGALWIATHFIPNVELKGSLQLLLIIGAVLGIMNAILKPVLNLLTLPLRILSLGLSSFILNMLIVWLIDIYFAELIIEGFKALFLTTIAVWGLTIILAIVTKKR